VRAGLFLCLFASQSAVIAMAPSLSAAAADLDVSVSAAGQLRTITGLVAGVTALALGLLARRLSLGRQLLAGTVLLAAGAAGSAAAGSYGALALAQVPVGVGVAVLTTAAVVAAAEWAPPESRTAVLSWTLNGQPAAWIVGMPILGSVGWRLGWLVLPLLASIAAALFLLRRAVRCGAATPVARMRDVLRDRALTRWLTSELFANAGWAGTLVYSGATFTETYGISTAATGVLLAIGATGYVAGNLSARRLARDPSADKLALLALALVLTVACFGVARTSVAVSTVLFSAAAVAAGARTLVASAYGLSVAPAFRASLTSLRAATMQFGYFLGSIAGGLALAVGGYGAVGLTMSCSFLLASATVARRRSIPIPSTLARCGGRLFSFASPSPCSPVPSAQPLHAGRLRRSSAPGSRTPA
jgi:predicted MFS family arabinose efflux permease